MKLKIFFVICMGCLMFGCQAQKTERFLWDDRNLTDAVAMPKQSVRAAMLLPLSGKAETVGKAFQNSGMMALQEQQKSPLELLFFDTKGTPDGTKEAWANARLQNPDIVIGPIFATELEALKDMSPDVPVLSFTTDSSLMKRGIYTMGVLIPNQVERLVQHMCENGQKKIAVMGPEDKTGELAMNVLMERIETCPDMKVSKISLYEPDTVNFNPAVLKIVPKPVDPKKKNLTEEEKQILETPIEDRIDFDALIIFDDGVRLQQVVSLLAYYDVSPKVVPFYGLANWQTMKDRALVGGYFAATPVARAERFNARYRHIFGQNPPRVSSLAYDAVALVSILAEKHALANQNLMQEEGYNGVNGRFRLKSDGTNERLLGIFQIQPNLSAETVSPEPVTFEKITDFEKVEPDIPVTDMDK